MSQDAEKAMERLTLLVDDEEGERSTWTVGDGSGRAALSLIRAELARAKQRDLISDSVIVKRLDEIKNLKEILGKTFDRAEKAEATLAELEQCRVQLAGCGVAALGGVKEPVAPGKYGYSASLQDVYELRQKYDKAEAELDAARPLLDEAMKAEQSPFHSSAPLLRAALTYRAKMEGKEPK